MTNLHRSLCLLPALLALACGAQVETADEPAPPALTPAAQLAPDRAHAVVTLAPDMNTEQIGGFVGAASDWSVFTHGEVQLRFQVGACTAAPCAQLGAGGYTEGLFQLPNGDDLTVRHAAQQQIGQWLGRAADPAFFGPAVQPVAECTTLQVAAAAAGADQSFELATCDARVAVAAGTCARITMAAGMGRSYVGYERDFQHECAMVKANAADLVVAVSAGATGWLRVETATIPTDQPDSCTLSCD